MYSIGIYEITKYSPKEAIYQILQTKMNRVDILFYCSFSLQQGKAVNKAEKKRIQKTKKLYDINLNLQNY